MSAEANQVEVPDAAAYAAMWDMVTAYRWSQLAHVLARYSVAEHLAAGRRRAEQIAAAESLSVDATARLLRAAASVGLAASVDGVEFSATPLLNTLGKDTPGSLRGLAIALSQPGHWLPWGRLAEAVATGRPQTADALGMSLWDYYGENPVEAAHLNDAMAGMTGAVGEEAARLIDTRGRGVVADIGGGLGHLLHFMMAANPELHGLVFDLPSVVESSAAAAKAAGLDDRLTTVGGDFFVSVPEADTYLLRYVLHDWDDEQAIRILRNCRRAMRPGGRVLVLELVLEEAGGPSMPPSQDINMLVLFGGRERTVADFARLFDAAGLRLLTSTSTATPLQILEAGV